MPQTNRSRGIRLTLLVISLCQLGSLAISSVISEILTAFPQASDQTAQFLMTFPGLFILAASLSSAFLTRFVSQKRLAVTGLFLNVLTAIGGLLFHGSMALLFCWAATLGLGLGLWMPIVNAMASRYFEGGERASLLGQISGAQNVGAILMTVLGGLLAILAWHYVYLVYFIAVPGLVCAAIFLPDEKAERPAPRQKRGGRLSLRELGIDSPVLLFGGIQFFFSLPYNAGPANFSLLLAERDMGGASTAGLLSGLMLFGGILSGWAFGVLDRKLRKGTIPLGFALLAAGFLGLGLSRSLPAAFVFTVISGMSLPLVLPQSSLGVIEGKRPAQFAMANAVLLAFGNLGAFCSPLTTSLSAVVTGSASIAERMIFCAALSLLGAVITALILRHRKDA